MNRVHDETFRNNTVRTYSVPNGGISISTTAFRNIVVSSSGPVPGVERLVGGLTVTRIQDQSTYTWHKSGVSMRLSFFSMRNSWMCQSLVLYFGMLHGMIYLLNIPPGRRKTLPMALLGVPCP